MNRKQELEETNNAFPEYLQKLAIPKAISGSEFLSDKMNGKKGSVRLRITKDFFSGLHSYIKKVISAFKKASSVYIPQSEYRKKIPLLPVKNQVGFEY